MLRAQRGDPGRSPVAARPEPADGDPHLAAAGRPRPAFPSPSTRARRRERAVPWRSDAIVDPIHPRSVCASAGDGIGALYGVSSRLDQRQGLGREAVSLTPVRDPPRTVKGDVDNDQDVMVTPGTLGDREAMPAAMRSRGLRPVMDRVVDDSPDEHAWCVEPRRSEVAPCRDPAIRRPDNDGLQPTTGRGDRSPPAGLGGSTPPRTKMAWIAPHERNRIRFGRARAGAERLSPCCAGGATRTRRRSHSCHRPHRDGATPARRARDRTGRPPVRWAAGRLRTAAARVPGREVPRGSVRPRPARRRRGGHGDPARAIEPTRPAAGQTAGHALPRPPPSRDRSLADRARGHGLDRSHPLVPRPASPGRPGRGRQPDRDLAHDPRDGP